MSQCIQAICYIPSRISTMPGTTVDASSVKICGCTFIFIAGISVEEEGGNMGKALGRRLVVKQREHRVNVPIILIKFLAQS